MYGNADKSGQKSARVCPKDIDLQVDSCKVIHTTRFELVKSRFLEPSIFRTSW